MISRLTVGFLLLLLLFGLASLWQARVVHTARTGVVGADDGITLDPYPSDWGLIRIGAPSGADVVQAAAPMTRGAEIRSRPPVEAPHTTEVREFALTVESGQTLSGICLAHYGSSRTGLVSALSRWNRLTDPSRLQVGQKLRLPPMDALLKP